MAIKKMLATLDDPFTRFLEPEKFKSLQVHCCFSLNCLFSILVCSILDLITLYTPSQWHQSILLVANWNLVKIPKVCQYFLWRQSGTQGAITGVGLSIGYPTKFDGSPAGLVVISAAPEGPANRAGILSGDIILAIDDTSTETMGIYDAAELLQWVSYLIKSLAVKSDLSF